MMKRILIYLFVLVVSSCINRKIFVSNHATNLSLELVNDSIFEYKNYYNDFDTAFLHYSYGTYQSLNRNMYLLNSMIFNNLSFPIHVSEDSLKLSSDSLRIILKTNILNELMPEVNITLHLDSLSIDIMKSNVDTLIRKRCNEIKIIKVTTHVIKSRGLPKLKLSSIQSSEYEVKHKNTNKITIDFPIYDYLFHYEFLQNQLIEDNGKFLILKSQTGDKKVLKGGRIYHWWQYNPWEDSHRSRTVCRE